MPRTMKKCSAKSGVHLPETGYPMMAWVAREMMLWQWVLLSLR